MTAGLQNSQESWELFEEEYLGSTKVRGVKLLTLKKEFERLRMQEGESIKEYFTRVINLVN